MGGHSHWSQVKRQKGVADARRGQLFTKLGREITVASRQGGADPTANFRLRLAVQKARESNMPNDTIERAMKRGASGPDAAELIEATYEGYGPGGVAVLIDVVTDNRNRSVSEIRAAMGRAGGNLSEAGSVAWLFDNKGLIAINAKDGDERRPRPHRHRRRRRRRRHPGRRASKSTRAPKTWRRCARRCRSRASKSSPRS